MIVIENPIKDPNIDSDSLDILGLGIVTITDKAHNVFYVKGIGNSLMNKMIQLYKEEIRLKQEGKIIDLVGGYTVYIHFYKLDYEIISIFYLNEKDKLVKYEDLCKFSKKLLKSVASRVSAAEINKICREAVPCVTGISALFIITTTGHSLFKKIRKDKEYLSDNCIQIGGFISAILMFANEVVGKHSGDNLEAISFANQKIYLIVRGEVIFAYLVEKSVVSNNAKRFIELLSEDFLMSYSEHLADFNGDLSPFEKFGKVVDKYFII